MFLSRLLRKTRRYLSVKGLRTQSSFELQRAFPYNCQLSPHNCSFYSLPSGNIPRCKNFTLPFRIFSLSTFSSTIPHSFFISSWNLFFSEFLSVAITSFLFQNLGQKKKRKRKKRSFLINIDRHSILYRSILYYRRYLLMQNRLDIPRLDSPVRCQPLQSFLCTPATKNPPDESRKIRRSRKVPTFQTTNALQECVYIYTYI